MFKSIFYQIKQTKIIRRGKIVKKGENTNIIMITQESTTKSLVELNMNRLFSKLGSGRNSQI